MFFLKNQQLFEFLQIFVSCFFGKHFTQPLPDIDHFCWNCFDNFFQLCSDLPPNFRSAAVEISFVFPCCFLSCLITKKK